MSEDSDEAPAEPVPAVPTPPSRRFPVLSVSIAVLAIMVAAAGIAVWIGRQTKSAALPSTAASVAPPPLALPVAGPPPALADAAVLAFGSAKPVVKGEWQKYPISVSYAPKAIIPLADGKLALVSVGTTLNAAHVNSGFLAVHYLAWRDGAWKLAGAWPRIGETGSFGTIGSWRRRDDLFDGPGIELTGGWSGQGCSVEDADLIELTPAKPIARAEVLSNFDFPDPAKAGDEGQGCEQAPAPPGASDVQYGATQGKILAHLKGQSFRVVYDGDFARTVTWGRRGETFVPSANGASLPSC